MIVSHEVFIWFATVMTVGLSIGWAVADIIRWVLDHRRERAAGDDAPERTDDHARRNRNDRVFGYVMGIAIGVLGCVGAVLFHMGR